MKLKFTKIGGHEYLMIPTPTVAILKQVIEIFKRSCHYKTEYDTWSIKDQWAGYKSDSCLILQPDGCMSMNSYRSMNGSYKAAIVGYGDFIEAHEVWVDPITSFVDACDKLENKVNTIEI